MRCSMLMENKASAPAFCAEHGLSIYIESEGGCLLFDMGQSDAYAKNAETLGIRLADVDVAVLSYAHYDHGGGLGHFLQHNQKAKVYVSDKAFGEYYARTAKAPRYIGLGRELEGNDRLVPCGGVCEIGDGLLLFSLPPAAPRRLQSEANQSLLERRAGGYVQDVFAHEQNLLLCEGDTRLLLCGCAHSGIVNILAEAERLCGAAPTAVMGGFHLYNPSTGQSVDDTLLNQIAGELRARPTRYYTFHCTGDDAFARLKQRLGDQLTYLAAGAQVDF